MNAGLLNPWYLLGALALALPVLIHLVARHESGGDPFPSLMFVRRVPVRRRRRRELRDRPLLLLRCLALALLTLTFAGPYCSRPPAPGGATVPSSQHVILLDRSWSMRLHGAWDAAVAAAHETLGALAPGARAALVSFDQQALTLIPMSADLARLRRALNGIEPGDGGTAYARALSHAVTLFDAPESGANGGPRKVVLISDLQSAGAPAALRLPDGINLSLRRSGGDAREAPLAIEVDVPGGDAGLAERRLRTRFTATAAEAGLHLRVAVDGRAAVARPFSGAELAAGSAGFSVVPAPGRVTPVTVAIDGAVPGIDFNLALEQADPIQVFGLAAAARGGGVYLRQALALARRPQIELRLLSAAVLDAAVLQGSDVVLLDGARLEAGASLASLRQFVESGGGLLVFAGDQMRAHDLLRGAGLLPGVPSAGAAADSRESRITELDARHAVFEDLPAGQLQYAAVWRRAALDAREQDRVIARFDDGAAAILERRVGAGRSILVATSAAAHWSALALEPGFAPLMVNLVRHLAQRRDQAAVAATQVGAAVDIASYASALGAGHLLDRLHGGGAILAQAPGGAITRIGAAQPVLSTTRAGFYNLYSPGGSDTPVPVAVNIDPLELHAGRLSVAAFGERVRYEPPVHDTPARAARGTATDSVADTPWWYLMLAAIALFLTEAFLSARLLMRARSKALTQ